MPTPALTPGDYVIGKAIIGWREVGVLTAYARLFTIEDTVIRLNAEAEYFDPSTEFDLGGPVAGFQYAAGIGGVQVECSLPQLDAATFGLLVPGSTSATRTTAAVAGSDTTLAAAAAVGDTNVKVASVTGWAVGDYAKIDTGGSIEYRRITTVGTAGAGGTGLTFFEPLSLPHASGVAFTEVDGDGKTVITPPAPGRVSTGTYKEFRVSWPRPDAAWGSIVIYRGLVDVGESPIELTTGARTMARVRATIVGFRDPANPDAAPFILER